MKTSRRGSSDFVFKTFMIGDYGTGKTSIMSRYFERKFTFCQVTTIGLEMNYKNIMLGGKKIQLQVWDTAGQERFRSIARPYYKSAKGIILTYSCESPSSFANVEHWMKEINDHANEKIVKILFANKCDAPNRCITREEGQSLADRYGIKFFEGSAKDDVNIKEVFEAMASEIKGKFFSNENELIVEGMPLNPEPAKNNEKIKCC